MKVERFCNTCNAVTEHDHEEHVNKDIKISIDVCCLCGNADVDADSIDDNIFMDFDDYTDDIEDPEEFEEMNEDRKCRICGCTWFHACPGGCYWVEEDLCSACVDKEEQ